MQIKYVYISQSSNTTMICKESRSTILKALKMFQKSRSDIGSARIICMSWPHLRDRDVLGSLPILRH